MTLDSNNAIQGARAAYDALTEAQKRLVGNYDVLIKAEAEYEAITGKFEDLGADGGKDTDETDETDETGTNPADPKTPNSPKTGEDSGVMLYGIMLLLGLAGVSALVIWRGKRKDRETV